MCEGLSFLSSTHALNPLAWRHLTLICSLVRRPWRAATAVRAARLTNRMTTNQSTRAIATMPMPRRLRQALHQTLASRLWWRLQMSAPLHLRPQTDRQPARAPRIRLTRRVRPVVALAPRPDLLLSSPSAPVWWVANGSHLLAPSALPTPVSRPQRGQPAHAPRNAPAPRGATTRMEAIVPPRP